MPEVIARTDVGRERDRNEDSVLERPLEGTDGHLLVVADGMGGHQAGDVASQTAVETLEAELADAFPADRDRRAVLADAIATANERIHERAAEEGTEGMGTTVVAAVVRDGAALLANVGDSRAYRVGDEAEQVTVDQNLAREMVREGALDEGELAEHPHRHVLSQALGSSDDVEPEFFECDLEGDTLLLCSDGLPEEVPDDAIGDIVDADEPLAEVADGLIERANENGGSDNVSAVLYRRGASASGDDDDGRTGDEDDGRDDDAGTEGLAESLLDSGRRLLGSGGE